ncbi:MAG: hypothetical protein K2W33_01900 [Burkholderiales bacterium]|nr:hypothetical protein [Burkholderiales bacterium]
MSTPLNTATHKPDFQLIFMMQALKFIHVRSSLGVSQASEAQVWGRFTRYFQLPTTTSLMP